MKGVVALSVLRRVDDRIEVFLVPWPGDASAASTICEEFQTAGLFRRDEVCWTGPASLLEPACTLLDRLGVLWGVYDPDAPRTFAERLFAECPEGLGPRLYESVRSVLCDGSADLHVALLDAAWSA